MPNALQRYQRMCVLLGIGDLDFERACSTMQALSADVGTLMSRVSAQLVHGEGCTLLFDDDLDAATSFKNQLTTFVLKATQARFTESYCEYVAGFADRFEPRLPMQALETVVGLVGEWLVDSLGNATEGDPEEFRAVLKAWQKLMAVNFDLLLSAYETTP